MLSYQLSNTCSYSRTVPIPVLYQLIREKCFEHVKCCLMRTI
uniref:Uncharacterized protein n=1 Tax=Rhizophora mucronata TaxID=61149 RepID=A0A2P2QYJ0_RHIMU